MRITEITTSDGHLRDLALVFSPNLNCIIGARGTCKSTIIETLRFVFDADPQRVDELLGIPSDSRSQAPHFGLIQATLRGGTARVSLTTDDPTGVRRESSVERDANSKPRVYLDGVKAIPDLSLLNQIEIYSQGELQDIAIDPAKRLELVDRPNKSEIDSWKETASGLAREIARLGPEVRELREAIASSGRTLREGEPLRSRFAEIQASRPEMSPESVEKRSRFLRREQLQKHAEDLVASYLKEFEEVENAVSRLTEKVPQASELSGSGSGPLESLASRFATSAEAGGRLLSSIEGSSEMQELLVDTRREYEEAKAEYANLLRVETAVSDAVKQEDHFREEVAKLNRVGAELAEYEVQLDERLATREARREALRNVRIKIFHQRLEEVERINSTFSEQIVLTLNHGTFSSGYREGLDGLLAGSRLRDQPALCEQIAAVLPPDRFVAFVDNEDAEGLAAVLNRDSGQMMRLISHLSDSDALYELEGKMADDELEITMFVDGIPRSVREMSKGQKATAILPLVLRDADYPLVLDQPEDDLDNRFIFETLVQKVEGLKLRRQLIFVTHNANIPVVGDAEQIFVMSMSGPDRAVLQSAGNVDQVQAEIISLLEGGEEAFERRSETYGYPSKE